jgi:hypothetical protein
MLGPVNPAPMEEAEPRRRSLPLAAALFTFTLVLLLFSGQAIDYVGPSDAALYLSAARVAPAHVLFDLRPLVLHPPAYPIAIRAASLVAGGIVSGALALGILCNSVLVVVTHRLGLAIGLTPLAALAGALLLASSRILSYTAEGVFREPWQVLVVTTLLLVLVGGTRGPWRKAGAVLLAILGALTWDPIVLMAPFAVASGVLARRRRAGILVALVLAGTWLGWALWRRNVLESRPTYPAGIDGMVEDTTRVPAAALFNPNFFPETKQHNAYFWKREPTPEHLVEIAGPAVLAEDVIYADYPQSRAFDVASGSILGLAGLGLVASVLGAGTGPGRQRLRLLAAVAAPMAFLGSPGLLGNTGRYAMSLAPLVFLLAGSGLAELLRVAGSRWSLKPLPHPVGAALALAALAAVPVAWTRPHFTLTRPDVFQTRSVAQVLGRTLPGASVAAAVDLPPGLAWLLPGQRVLALPLAVERLDAFFQDYDPDILVVPRVVKPWQREGATVAERDHAYGLPVFAELARRASAGTLVPLGVALEAEVSDRARVHSYEVIYRPHEGRAAPAAFGFFFPPGEAGAAALAVEAGQIEPADAATLAANRETIAASGDPGAPRLVAALRARGFVR